MAWGLVTMETGVCFSGRLPPWCFIPPHLCVCLDNTPPAVHVFYKLTTQQPPLPDLGNRSDAFCRLASQHSKRCIYITSPPRASLVGLGEAAKPARVPTLERGHTHCVEGPLPKLWGRRGANDAPQLCFEGKVRWNRGRPDSAQPCLLPGGGCLMSGDVCDWRVP